MANNPNFANQLYIQDLTADQIAQIQSGMLPNGLSEEGFLGPSDDLATVIQADTSVLRDLGITHKQVGDRLDSLMGQAMWQWELATKKGIGYFDARESGAIVDAKLRITAQGWAGSQSWPFPKKDAKNIFETCGSGSMDYTITNQQLDTRIKFPSLIAHLVRDHHFFEGSTPYRLDPREAVAVLDLKPGVDYTPITESESIWTNRGSTSDPKGKIRGSQSIIENATEIIEINPNTQMYFGQGKAVIVATETFELANPLRADGSTVDAYRNEIWRGVSIWEKTVKTYTIG